MTQADKPTFRFFFLFVLSTIVSAGLAQSASADPHLIAERSENSLQAASPALDRFENEIKSFEEHDQQSPPPAAPTVFVGSSSIRKWTDLESTFREFRALNRGFGGSTIPEVNHYVPRIVTKYAPVKVVLFAGSNDIAELHHNGKQISDDFQAFVALVHKALPKCQIYYISNSVAPSRLKWKKDYDDGNRLIAAYVKTKPYLHYIDVLPCMRDSSGSLRTDLFGPDRLHMTADGYARWTPIIKSALK
ncbi:MAG TPA: GDSL-type esterase/lipase family protein [Chroococcales cyanobacterium]